MSSAAVLAKETLRINTAWNCKRLHSVLLPCQYVHVIPVNTNGNHEILMRLGFEETF